MTRLAKFAKNYPTVEGVLDTTWDLYSLDLFRYVVLAHLQSWWSNSVCQSTQE